jgi:hypothetical protein
MSTATQTSLPSRVAVRWYQLALTVLGVALAAVTVLAISLAVHDSTPTPLPTGNPSPVSQQPCVKLHDPC